MLFEQLRTNERRVQTSIDKCVINRRKWQHQPKPIKMIKNNENSQNHHKSHVKQIHRWPVDQCHRHHGRCMAWWIFTHRPTPTLPHRMQQLVTQQHEIIYLWFHRNRKHQMQQSKIDVTQIEPRTTRAGNHKIYTRSVCVWVYCMCNAWTIFIRIQLDFVLSQFLPSNHSVSNEFSHQKSQSFNFHTRKSTLLQKSLDERTSTAYAASILTKSPNSAATTTTTPTTTTKLNQQPDYHVSSLSIQESHGIVDATQKRGACYMPLHVTIPTCCLRSQINELHKRNQFIANVMSKPSTAAEPPSNEIDDLTGKNFPIAIEVIWFRTMCLGNACDYIVSMYSFRFNRLLFVVHEEQTQRV